MKWYVILLIIVLVVLLVLGLLFRFLSATGSNKKVWDYQWLLKRPIAHRGYHLNDKNVPENSSIAFQRAIEQGYNIEIDLNLSKDNKVVVFHDSDVNRMCGVNKKVHDLTLKELQELKLKNGEFSMMELSDFLNLVNQQTGVLIEYKGVSKEIDDILCEESMKILKDYQGEWVMQSFQPTILRWFKKNYPDVPRGQLCHNYLPSKEERKKQKGKEVKGHSNLLKWMFTNMFANFIGRPNFISRECMSINFMVRYLHKRGAPLLVWTINNQNAFDFVQGKVNNVIFEYLPLNEYGKIKQ